MNLKFLISTLLLVVVLFHSSAFCSRKIPLRTYTPEDLNAENIITEVWLGNIHVFAHEYGVPAVTHQASFDNFLFQEIFSKFSENGKGAITGDKYRMPEELRTRRNRNIAISYATYRNLVASEPRNKPIFDNTMRELGLNPNNNCRETTTVIGMANQVAAEVIEHIRKDGSNKFGDANGKEFNKRSYEDTTKYEPVNPADRVVDRDRWHPITVPNRPGGVHYTIQKFKIPQMAYMNTTVGFNPADEICPPPVLHSKSPAEYRNQFLDVMKATAETSDRQRLIGELFDDKLFGFPLVIDAALSGVDTSMEEWVTVQSAINVGNVDSIIWAWYWKMYYDRIRPETVANFVYPEERFNTYAKYQGHVNMKGKDFKSYTPSDAFPEYPSGTSCLCRSIAETLRLYLKDKGGDYHFKYVIPKGESVYEPGFRPLQDTTIEWHSIDDMLHDCVQSRKWIGVHFQDAIDATAPCKKIGSAMYKKWKRLMGGSYRDQVRNE